jgi:hypothetical protein
MVRQDKLLVEHEVIHRDIFIYINGKQDYGSEISTWLEQP